jgi:2-oxoisovalerate dehydrogenase E1 component
VVDECRERGGPGDELIARLAERIPGLKVRALMGLDCYIPLGDAANLVLVQEPEIEAAATALVEGA